MGWVGEVPVWGAVGWYGDAGFADVVNLDPVDRQL